MTPTVHSIWLMLSPEDDARFTRLMRNLAARFGTPDFAPHLTVRGDSETTPAALEAMIEEAARAVPAIVPARTAPARSLQLAVLPAPVAPAAAASPEPAPATAGPAASVAPIAAAPAVPSRPASESIAGLFGNGDTYR